MSLQILDLLRRAPAFSCKPFDIRSKLGASLIEGKHGIKDFLSLSHEYELSLFFKLISGYDLDMFYTWEVFFDQLWVQWMTVGGDGQWCDFNI